MNIEIEYKDNEERTDIIKAHNDKYLTEERNTAEGNYLVFSSFKPISIELEELKEHQLATDMAVFQLMMEGVG